MENITDNQKLWTDFNSYLRYTFIKHLTLIVSICISILLYYLYSDWFLRQNAAAALWRLAPIVLLSIILILHLVSKTKFNKLKNNLFAINYMVLQLMMFSICLIYLHHEALAPSVTGVILVVFLISMDNKQNKRITLLIYSVPITVFTFLLFVFYQPTQKEFFTIFDVYPIVVIGYIINRIQYNLRFKLFRSNYLLKREQDKTRTLYAETLKVNEELNKSNSTKDRFFGIIAHDIKNPISTIWGLSDLLMLDDEMDRKSRLQCAKGINQCVKNTLTLLESLLNWARAQNTSITPKAAMHKTSGMVAEVLQVMDEAANKKNVKLVNNIPDDVEVYADKNMFETVIRNLLSNAIKYTYAGGTISVDAQLTFKGEHRFTQIAIKDDGVGMSGEQVSKLFKISSNKSAKGTDGESGTGFGLLLVKEFVDKHNGTIAVKSTPNKGSVFTIELPLAN